MDKFGIGQPVRRKEDVRLLTGRGTYTDDMNRPGQAHAVVLRSPHAAARITRLDTTAARAMPGVLLVLAGEDVEGLGVLRAAPAIGSVACSMFLARHPLDRHVGRWMFAGVVVYGISTLVFGLSTHFLLSVLALFISGIGDMVSVVIRMTLMQLDTPDEIRGRVGAVNTIFIGASNQLGEFESGAVAAAFGPVASVVSGAIGTLVVAVLWFRLFPALARRDTYTQQ